MNTELLRTITTEEVDTYHRDGVLLLKNMFNKNWIKLLNKGLDINCESPTERHRIWDKDDSGHTMFYDTLAWQGIREYKKFIFNSPAAQICGKLLKSTTVNFFFDAVFVRSAGTKFETPWHQDEPYWSIEGYDACTLWMPLVPVKEKNCLSFVPPDINADPKHFGVVSWEMQPGDCIVFNGRTMHGGSGKLDDDCNLRVFTTKWLGDDAHIKFRNYGMDPDFSSLMIKKGLKSGDRPDTDMYPQIWPKS